MSDFKLYTGFTEQREGGLSKAKTDTASKYPVPDGSGYHTNKGITWETFERLSKVLGYPCEPKLFYKMPDAIFEKIFEHYWQQSKADLIENQAIANLVFQAMWGGGHRNLIKDIQKFVGALADGDLGNKTAAKINQYPNKKHLYENCHQFRLNYLRSLQTYKDNGRGWERRMKMLFNHNQKYL